MPTRVRFLHEYLGQHYDIGTGVPRQVQRLDVQNETSSLTSSGHWHWKNPGLSDVGGFFSRSYRTIDYNLSDYCNVQSGKFPIYNGKFYAASPTAPVAPNQDPYFWGAQAYDACKPTKPSFDLATNIGELKDLPSMVKGNFESFVPNFARYDKALLSWQFGWRPMIKAVREMIDAQQKIEKRLDWLIRNNGRPVRTRATIVDRKYNMTVASSGPGNSNTFPVLVTAGYRNAGQRITTTYSTERVWASARMRYWLPTGPGGVVYKKQLIRLLNGGYVNASVLYNLVPWSWLIDWFSNVDYLVKNLDAGIADRLAADYFYVMGHFENVAINETFFEANHLGVSLPVTAKTTHTSGLKIRIKGNPFGLSVGGTLTPMQSAILGALGTSRL